MARIPRKILFGLIRLFGIRGIIHGDLRTLPSRMLSTTERFESSERFAMSLARFSARMFSMSFVTEGSVARVCGHAKLPTSRLSSLHDEATRYA